MVVGNSIGGFFIVLTLGDLVRPVDFKPPITITITTITIHVHVEVTVLKRRWYDGGRAVRT